MPGWGKAAGVTSFQPKPQTKFPVESWDYDKGINEYKW